MKTDTFRFVKLDRNAAPLFARIQGQGLAVLVAIERDEDGGAVAVLRPFGEKEDVKEPLRSHRWVRSEQTAAEWSIPRARWVVPKGYELDPPLPSGWTGSVALPGAMLVYASSDAYIAATFGSWEQAAAQGAVSSRWEGRVMTLKRGGTGGFVVRLDREAADGGAPRTFATRLAAVDIEGGMSQTAIDQLVAFELERGEGQEVRLLNLFEQGRNKHHPLAVAWARQHFECWRGSSARIAEYPYKARLDLRGALKVTFNVRVETPIGEVTLSEAREVTPTRAEYVDLTRVDWEDATPYEDARGRGPSVTSERRRYMLLYLTCPLTGQEVSLVWEGEVEELPGEWSFLPEEARGARNEPPMDRISAWLEDPEAPPWRKRPTRLWYEGCGKPREEWHYAGLPRGWAVDGELPSAQERASGAPVRLVRVEPELTPVQRFFAQMAPAQEPSAPKPPLVPAAKPESKPLPADPPAAPPQPTTPATSSSLDALRAKWGKK